MFFFESVRTETAWEVKLAALRSPSSLLLLSLLFDFFCSFLDDIWISDYCPQQSQHLPHFFYKTEYFIYFIQSSFSLFRSFYSARFCPNRFHFITFYLYLNLKIDDYVTMNIHKCSRTSQILLANKVYSFFVNVCCSVHASFGTLDTLTWTSHPQAYIN